LAERLLEPVPGRASPRDLRASSAGVCPYWALNARVKWLPSANWYRAATSDAPGRRSDGASSSSRACSSRLRRMYAATVSPAVSNARCSVRTETLSWRASAAGVRSVYAAHDAVTEIEHLALG
jgi:ribosome modulation factor